MARVLGASHLVPAAPSRRRIAQLGGSTTQRDVATAVALLAAGHGPIAGRMLAFERAFASTVGARHAVTFWAGRTGLHGVLRVLGIGAGDEVLVQVPTHVVVANAIRFTGARPVYVDCDPRTVNLDLVAAEAAITRASKAIVLQHTFGVAADPVAASALAARYGLFLVEDCVHALGSTYAGRPLGTFGDAAFFSLEETKTISTTMGGVVVTDDDAIAAGLERFRETCPLPSPGRTRRYLTKFAVYGLLTHPSVYAVSATLNEAIGHRSPLPRATGVHEANGIRPDDYLCRFSDEQAVLGLRQLAHLERNLAHRRKIAGAYDRLLPSFGLQRAHVPPGADPAFLRYPVRVPDVSAAVALVAPVAQLGTWFTSILEESSAPVDLGYRQGSCPVAEDVVGHLVNLPTHLRVGIEDAERIVAALAAAATP